MPRSRSWLFVPGDSERKIDKAIASDADRIIIDLEDAIAPTRRDEARALVSRVLTETGGNDERLCIRINPLDSDDAGLDLEALAGRLPPTIMLPKVRDDDDLIACDRLLSELEHNGGRPKNSVGVIALVTETVSMTATLPAMQRPPERVSALTWGGEDLSAALGTSANKDEHGAWLPVFSYARTQCLLAAKRFDLAAIDTLYSDFRDEAGMARHASAALRDGFDGVLSIHPAQISPIHAAYRPDTETVAWANAVIAAFDATPGAGVAQLDGKMLDRPHLTQARKILERLE